MLTMKLHCKCGLSILDHDTAMLDGWLQRAGRMVCCGPASCLVVSPNRKDQRSQWGDLCLFGVTMSFKNHVQMELVVYAGEGVTPKCVPQNYQHDTLISVRYTRWQRGGVGGGGVGWGGVGWGGGAGPVAE